MASILYSRDVGDLMVGKPKLKEFHHSASVREALETLIELNDCELPVWRLPRKKSLEKFGAIVEKYECAEIKEARFIGMLSMLDIMGHLASDQSLNDPVAALDTAVSDIMTSDPALLKYVAAGTRLMDALELIKGGTRRLLVPISSGSQRVSRRFSKHKYSFASRWWMPPNPDLILSKPEKPLGYCCLSVEDVARFLLGCLGALAPFPLDSICSQGIINTNPPLINGSDPAKMALGVCHQAPANVQAVAVAQEIDGRQILIGEISAIGLTRCGFRVALALATLSAADFVAYVDFFGNRSGTSDPEMFLSDDDIRLASLNYHIQNKGRKGCSTVRSRIIPLTCRSSNSVAAVMTQMLAYRTSHVWVTEDDGKLVGIVTYSDIMAALTTTTISKDKHRIVMAKDICPS